MLCFSYGMAKSGSTYVYQMTRHLLWKFARVRGGKTYELGDFVPDLRGDYFPGNRDIDCHLDQIMDEVGQDLDRVMVIKLYSPCTPKIKKLIESGSARATSTYRHPADIGLSLLDVARNEREEGKTRFSSITDHRVAMDTIETNLANLRTWHSCSGVLAIHYDAIAGNPYGVGEALANYLGVDLNARNIVNYFEADKSRIGEFNVGQKDRHSTEMADELKASYQERFGDFISFVEANRGRLETTAGTPWPPSPEQS